MLIHLIIPTFFKINLENFRPAFISVNRILNQSRFLLTPKDINT